MNYWECFRFITEWDAEGFKSCVLLLIKVLHPNYLMALRDPQHLKLWRFLRNEG